MSVKKIRILPILLFFSTIVLVSWGLFYLQGGRYGYVVIEGVEKSYLGTDYCDFIPHKHISHLQENNYGWRSENSRLYVFNKGRDRYKVYLFDRRKDCREKIYSLLGGSKRGGKGLTFENRIKDFFNIYQEGVSTQQ